MRVYRESDDLVASLKQRPEDFVVDEVWQPDFSGEGEHLYLFVEKTGQNTPWVADQLAKAFAVPAKHVGYSGLKDRQAITRQWFSLPVPPGKSDLEPDIEAVAIQKRARHSTKLRRGTHQGNSFQIRLRELDGSRDLVARDLVESRIAKIVDQGFPNYFGPQRFGHNGNNLRTGMQLSRSRKLTGHAKRGIYLSAMRSHLFNQVLAEQIASGNWDKITSAAQSDIELASGPMWGRGRPLQAEMGAEIESRVVAENAELCDILEHGGLTQERRILAQKCENLSCTFEGQDLLLEFTLPPGSYATVLIDEIVAIRRQSAD
jgi:tRNA pseudouridine13 synthase